MPDHIRAAIICDRAAGMSQSQLAAKYDVAQSTVSLAVRQSKAGTVASAAARPVRMDGESRHAYANRVQQWMRENDPEWFARWKVRNSAAVKRYWKRRRAKMEREAAKAAAALPAPAAPVPAPAPAVTPPPPRTWMQWLFGWVRW